MKGVLKLNIGERIKRRRQELGYSVDDIAKYIGKNRATIYRYESNEIEDLPTSVLEPLAKALHTTPAYLMGWDNPKPILLKKDYKKDNNLELTNEEIAVVTHFKNSDIDTKMQVLADLEIGILGSPVGEYRYKKLTKLQRQIAERIDEQLLALIQNCINLSEEGKKKISEYSNDLILLEQYKKSD